MPLRLHIIAIISTVFIIITILELFRRKRIEAKYGLLWLIMGFILFIFSIKIDILMIVAEILGFKIGSNALFLFGILFLSLIVLILTVVSSDLVNKNRRLTQEVTILNNKVENIENILSGKIGHHLKR